MSLQEALNIISVFRSDLRNLVKNLPPNEPIPSDICINILRLDVDLELKLRTLKLN